MGIVTFPSEAEWVQGEAEKPLSHCRQHSTTSKQLEGGMGGHSDTLAGSRYPRRGWHAAGYRGGPQTHLSQSVVHGKPASWWACLLGLVRSTGVRRGTLAHTGLLLSPTVSLGPEPAFHAFSNE